MPPNRVRRKVQDTPAPFVLGLAFRRFFKGFRAKLFSVCGQVLLGCGRFFKEFAEGCFMVCGGFTQVCAWLAQGSVDGFFKVGGTYFQGSWKVLGNFARVRGPPSDQHVNPRGKNT